MSKPSVEGRKAQGPVLAALVVALALNLVGFAGPIAVQGAEPALGLAPASHDYGLLDVGNSVRRHTFTVTNTGTANLDVTAVDIGVPNPGDFALAPEDCTGTPIAPGDDCTVEVGFEPTTDGPLAGQLQITSNAPGSPHTAALSGTGTFSTRISRASLSPNLYDAVGDVLRLSAAVTNSGDIVLTNVQVTTTGLDDDAGFVCQFATLYPTNTAQNCPSNRTVTIDQADVIAGSVAVAVCLESDQLSRRCENATATYNGPVGPTDSDNDGTPDDIDADGGAGTSPAGSFSDDTGDGSTTTGVVTDSAGLAVTITDAVDPDGITISVGGTGTARVTLSVCGGFIIRVNAGSEVTLTCGSVAIEVISGSASIVLGGGLTVVDIPAGGAAKVSGTEAAGYTVANEGDTNVTVTVDGTSSTITAGSPPGPLRAWDFVGFNQPIDNQSTSGPPVLNRVKAGQAIPVKWRLLSATGVPITNLATASITVTGFDCGTAATVDQIEEVAAGASGLKNLGNGDYSINWLSPKTYGGSCKVMHLNVGDGVSHDAKFQFTK